MLFYGEYNHQKYNLMKIRPEKKALFLKYASFSAFAYLFYRCFMLNNSIFVTYRINYQ